MYNNTQSDEQHVAKSDSSAEKNSDNAALATRQK